MARIQLTTVATALLAGLGLAACGSDSTTVAPDPGDQCVKSTEVCDGKDNDCDGKTDVDSQGKALTQTCDSGGKAGKQTCTGGSWGTCMVDCTPSAEVCDGKDNDCDGKADVDSQGKALTQVCDANGKVGTQTCTGGKFGDCVSNCQPKTEECNGKDDDCDEKVDTDANGKALTKVCDANGQVGTQTCTGGSWGDCVANCNPVKEECDGKDNDCDGKADVDGQGKPLTQTCDFSGKSGTQTCENGAWGNCKCNTPEKEVCNGKDDDCDGKTDEDDTGKTLSRSCDTKCGPGTEVCVNGNFEQCTAPKPSNEVCDGVDNDCDGTVDNGFDCPKGSTDKCGTDVGACEYGTKVCDGTCKWGACLGGTVATTEVCEGTKDEDCDGTVDNGCGCTNGQQKDCCGGTKITCAGGVWPACPAPPVETCNSQDDDCNGVIDDNLPATPYLVEEDITNVDDCAHAKQVATTVIENDPATAVTGYIYKKDLATDKDYFLFSTQELSDSIGCLAWPPPYECYTLTITLTEPTGQDYQMCLYDVDLPGSGYTCASPSQKICTAAGVNKITYNIAGGCGTDEGFQYYLEVSPANGVKDSCKPYQISIQLTGNGPQTEECTF